jgi:deoxyadenosine/deoxycytidine kinase
LFLNGAVKIETSLDPAALLMLMQQIEHHQGRRRTERWAARRIDLDLLLYGECVLDTPTLVLPHPRMAWRRFVLEPAAEVAGEMLHPTTRWSVGQLLDHMNTTRPYVAITGAIAAGKTRLAERLVEAISAEFIEEKPDWTALQEFYSDPARHAWQVELAFLEERAKALEAAAMSTGEASRWVVSDFWFDQSAAFARAWLSDEQWQEYLEKFEERRSAVIRPRLIVALDASADRLLERVRERGRDCERPLTRDQLDRIRKAVTDRISTTNVGPVLRAEGEDPDAIFADVLAAVRGME